MRHSLLYITILSIIFLILLSPYIVDNDLFTTEDNPLHTNTYLPAYVEKSQHIRSVIDEIGGISEGGALRISITRLDDSSDHMKGLANAITLFEDVIVEVDMDRDELNETIRNNRAEIEDVWAIMEKNVNSNCLKSLEIRQTDPGDPDKSTVTTFRGTQLEKIVSDPSNLISFGSDDQDTIISSDPVPVSQPVILSLTLNPWYPTYGDVMVFSGYLSGAAGVYSTVDLFVDSNWQASGVTDDNGYYSIPLNTGVLRRGGHTAYVLSGGVYSEIQKFSLVPHKTSLTLGCAETDGIWICEGILKSGRMPVDRAGVEIRVDGQAVTEVFTDESGRYSATLSDVPPGSSVQAVFRAGDLPLFDSESPEIRISGDGLPLEIIIISLLTLVFAGSLIYLRRRSAEPVDLVDEDLYTESTEIPEPQGKVLPAVDDVSATYQDHVEKNPSEAAFLLFRDLGGRLAERYRIKFPFSLTGRELLATVPENDLRGIFRRFVTVYEYTRYAGRATAENMDLLVSEWLSAIRSLMGGGNS